MPSQFNVETFSQNGVEREKLFQVPEAVDVYTYDPEIVLPLPGLDLRDKFSFLTTMKWEKRKGWDLLLRAYFKEFSAKDDVALVFLSKQSQEDQDKYLEEVKNLCYEVCLFLLVPFYSYLPLSLSLSLSLTSSTKQWKNCQQYNFCGIGLPFPNSLHFTRPLIASSCPLMAR